MISYRIHRFTITELEDVHLEYEAQMSVGELRKYFPGNDFPSAKYRIIKHLSECIDSFEKAGYSIPAEMMWISLVRREQCLWTKKSSMRFTKFLTSAISIASRLPIRQSFLWEVLRIKGMHSYRYEMVQ